MGGEMILVVEQEKDSNENQKEEVNKIWMHVALFKLLNILLWYLLWYWIINC
jgi:hypothetical protein